MDEPKPDTVDWAAKRLDISRCTMLALVKAGKIRCHRMGVTGRIIRITETHIQEYLQSTETQLASERPRVSFPPIPTRRIV